METTLSAPLRLSRVINNPYYIAVLLTRVVNIVTAGPSDLGYSEHLYEESFKNYSDVYLFLGDLIGGEEVNTYIHALSVLWPTGTPFPYAKFKALGRGCCRHKSTLFHFLCGVFDVEASLIFGYKPDPYSTPFTPD